MAGDDPRFLDALYFGVQGGRGFEPAMDMLCAEFDVPSGALLDFDPAHSDVSFTTSVGVLSGKAVLEYQRDFAAIDPAPPAFMRLATGTVMPTHRLLPEDVRRHGTFFGEFFRPLGLEECLGGVIAAHNGRFAMVGLHRSPDRAPFDQHDASRLACLMPHIARAIQLRRRFLELEQGTAALEHVVDRLAAGIAIFDGERRCLNLNARMERVVRERDGLSLDGGWLRAIDATANARLRRFEDDVRKGGAGGLVIVPRLTAALPYSVLVAPYAGDPAAFSAARRGVMFIVHDPRMPAAARPELLAAALNLPNAAARVVTALASGDDIETIAQRLDISISTVRYHLKLAFACTGTKRQGDLIRLAVAAIRDLSDHG